MGNVIPFERQSAKVKPAPSPVAVGQTPQSRVARRLCVGSALYGFALATAIEADAVPLVCGMILFGYLALAPGR